MVDGMHPYARKVLTFLLFTVVTTLILAVAGEWLTQVARDKGFFDNAGTRWDMAMSTISYWATSPWALYPVTSFGGFVAGLWVDACLRRWNVPHVVVPATDADELGESRPMFDISTGGSVSAQGAFMQPFEGFAKVESGGRLIMDQSRMEFAPAQPVNVFVDSNLQIMGLSLKDLAARTYEVIGLLEAYQTSDAACYADAKPIVGAILQRTGVARSEDIGPVEAVGGKAISENDYSSKEKAEAAAQFLRFLVKRVELFL